MTTTRRLLLHEPASKIEEVRNEGGWDLVHIAHDEPLYVELPDGDGYVPEPRYIAVFEEITTEQPEPGILDFLATVNAQWLEDEILRRSPTPVGQSAIAALVTLVQGQMSPRGEPAGTVHVDGSFIVPQPPEPGVEDWPSPTAPAPTDTPLDPHADEEIAKATGMDPASVAPESVEAIDPRMHSGKIRREDR